MKRGIVTISPHVIAEFLKPNKGHACRIIDNAIPANAKLIDAWYSHERRCFCLAIESDELPYEVHEGELMPYLPLPVMGWMVL